MLFLILLTMNTSTNHRSPSSLELPTNHSFMPSTKKRDEQIGTAKIKVGKAHQVESVMLKQHSFPRHDTASCYYSKKMWDPSRMSIDEGKAVTQWRII